MSGKPKGRLAKGMAGSRSRTDWERVRRDEAAGVEPATDAGDAPIAAPEFEAALKRRRGERGRQKSPTKLQVSVRLDRAIVEHFRDAGRGWQTRMNAALLELIRAAKTGQARRK